MTDFTEKHETQLANYFGGVFAGRCGLRSTMGGQLAAMRAAPERPKGRRRRWGDEYMLVKRQSHDTERANGEVSEDMLAAVRELREIEGVLRALEHADILVLRAHYTPTPTRVLPALAALLLGSQAAVEVLEQLASTDRELRREGTRRLTSAKHQAGIRLERAQAAYAAAETSACDRARAARRQQLMGGA